MSSYTLPCCSCAAFHASPPRACFKIGLIAGLVSGACRGFISANPVNSALPSHPLSTLAAMLIGAASFALIGSRLGHLVDERLTDESLSDTELCHSCQKCFEGYFACEDENKVIHMPLTSSLEKTLVPNHSLQED